MSTWKYVLFSLSREILSLDLKTISETKLIGWYKNKKITTQKMLDFSLLVLQPVQYHIELQLPRSMKTVFKINVSPEI